MYLFLFCYVYFAKCCSFVLCLPKLRRQEALRPLTQFRQAQLIALDQDLSVSSYILSSLLVEAHLRQFCMDRAEKLRAI